MKNLSLVFIPFLCFAGTANAGLYTSTGTSGNITVATVWTSGAIPAAGNTYQLDHDLGPGRDTTFVGDLVVNTGRLMWNSNAAATSILTIGSAGSLTLNSGGRIRVHNTSPFALDLNGRTFTLNGGALDLGVKSGSLSVSNGNLAGSGTINIVENSSAGPVGTMSFSNDVNFSGFSGVFNIKSDYAVFALPSIATESFGLTIAAGIYDNTANVSLTTLTIVGNSVDAGVYTRAQLLDYGTAEYGADWSSYISDNGGTLTVVPEPDTYALIGGLYALSFVILRRSSK